MFRNKIKNHYHFLLTCRLQSHFNTHWTEMNRFSIWICRDCNSSWSIGSIELWSHKSYFVSIKLNGSPVFNGHNISTCKWKKNDEKLDMHFKFWIFSFGKWKIQWWKKKRIPLKREMAQQYIAGYELKRIKGADCNVKFICGLFIVRSLIGPQFMANAMNWQFIKE